MLRTLHFLLVSGLCLGELETFPNHKVIQIETNTASEVEWVNLFAEKFDIDVWLSPAPGGHAHLMLSQEQLETLELPDYSVFVEDVQSVLDQSYKRAGQSWHQSYHDLAACNNYINDMANRFANVSGINARLFNIGQSFQGRTIYGIRFGGTGVSNPVRIVWNGIHHAREWIGPATLHYIIDSLLSGFSSDSRIRNIVERTEFHIVPILNPDGYQYTWTNNRMWRKTRSQYAGSSAFGTDPNRNWNFQWGGVGASTNPASDTYRGPSAASEPEVRQLAAYIDSLSNVRGYIDWHSYGQYILSALGYTSSRPAHYSQQVSLAASMNSAIQSVNNRRYTYGPSGSTLYPTSGSAPDYTYGHSGIVYSYTIELPGNPGGFALPPQYIVGVGQESVQGALVSVEAVLSEYDPTYISIS